MHAGRRRGQQGHVTCYQGEQTRKGRTAPCVPRSQALRAHKRRRVRLCLLALIGKSLVLKPVRTLLPRCLEFLHTVRRVILQAAR